MVRPYQDVQTFSDFLEQVHAELAIDEDRRRHSSIVRDYLHAVLTGVIGMSFFLSHYRLSVFKETPPSLSEWSGAQELKLSEVFATITVTKINGGDCYNIVIEHASVSERKVRKQLSVMMEVPWRLLRLLDGSTEVSDIIEVPRDGLSLTVIVVNLDHIDDVMLDDMLQMYLKHYVTPVSSAQSENLVDHFVEMPQRMCGAAGSSAEYKLPRSASARELVLSEINAIFKREKEARRQATKFARS